MKPRRKFAQQVGLIGALGVFAACSGEYRVGSDAASAGASNQVSTPPGFAGAPSAATDSGVSGAYALAGASSASTGQTFCGIQWTSASSVEFAPPDLVAPRLGRFLFGSNLGPRTLPAETTREWAGTLAVSSITSSDVIGLRGLHRFVSNLWPGTPTPERWSEYFASQQGTLSDLLTTDDLMPYGVGILTDPTVLSRAGISARGNFLLTRLLCMGGLVVPAHGDVSPLMPGQTRRIEHDQQLGSRTCTVCHEVIDPFGYALGGFATDGSYRTVENDLPIVTASTLELRQSGTLVVHDAQSLGQTLAGTCEAALCLTRSMLQDAAASAGLPNSGSDQEIAAIAAQFTAGGLRLRDLVRLVVESDVFLRAN